jgi:hypothetical protein
MRPVCFSCRESFPDAPAEVTARVLDLTQWPRFEGYGPLPGIRSAEFEERTPGVVGSRIRVVNTDGSTHVEEITEWQPEVRIQLRMRGFSPPLSRLAREFIETWELRREADVTMLTRSFELHPTAVWARPALWLIATLLKRAVARNLRQMRRGFDKP